MKYIKSLKIQIIFSFIFITIFTGLIVSFIDYKQSRDFLDEQINRELKNTADLIKKNIEDKFEDASTMVLEISQKKEITDLNRNQLQNTIENFVEFADIFFNVYIYDKNGYLISAAYFDKRPYKPYMGENLKNYKNIFSDYARRVFITGTPQFTDTFSSKGKKLILSYIAPIKKDNKINGIISCGIYVEDKKLQRLMERLKPPYNGFIYLLDQKGNLLGYTGNIPQKKETINIDYLEKQNTRFTIDNETFRYKLNKVKIANIYILIAIPEKAAYNLLKTYETSIIIYTLIPMLIAIILSIIMAHMMVKPILSLIEGLKEISKGNYSFRIPLKTEGEIGKTIEAFNEMAEKLQKNKIIEKIWIENWNK